MKKFIYILILFFIIYGFWSFNQKEKIEPIKIDEPTKQEKTLGAATAPTTQVLIGGFPEFPMRTTKNSYNNIHAGYVQSSAGWVLSENYRQQKVSTEGIISKLAIELTVAPGAGKSYLFALRVNSATSTLTCIVADTNTSCVDDSNSVAVSAGDLVVLVSAPSGTPAASAAQWSMQFVGTNNGESLALFKFRIAAVDAIYYVPINNSVATALTTETPAWRIVSTGGTMKNLVIKLESAPTAGNSIAFYLEKNEIDTAITCTITNPATTCSDTSNTATVAAGDILTMLYNPTYAPSVIEGFGGLTFLADTNGESLIVGGTDDDLSNSATEYAHLNEGNTGSGATIWTATETNVQQLSGQPQVLKNLNIRLIAAPGAGKSYTFTVMVNGVASALTCAVADTNITCSDTVNSVSLSANDNVSLRAVPAGTPTVTDAFWGVTGFVAIAGGGGTPSTNIDPIIDE